jgi:hypothetical protein
MLYELSQLVVNQWCQRAFRAFGEPLTGALEMDEYLDVLKDLR